MRKQAFLCLVAFGAAAWNGPLALAQTDIREPNPTGPDQPSSAPVSAATDPPSISLPKPTDAMLEPVPAAGRQLRDWSEAMTMIKARSVDLRSAVLDVTVAEGQSRVALASALPSLTASSVYTHQLITRDVEQQVFNPATGELTQRSSTTPLPNTLSANLQLRQPVFNLRAWYSIGTAHLSEEIARLSVDDLRRRLTLSTANTVLSLVTSERVAELNRAALYSALERLELAKAKFRNGASTGLDVERAEQERRLGACERRDW
ncbi:MAG: TolC family protein [Polyangiaceae bacterium]